MNISTMKCSENEWELKYSSTWCLIFILQMIGHTFFFLLSLTLPDMVYVALFFLIESSYFFLLSHHCNWLLVVLFFFVPLFFFPIPSFTCPMYQSNEFNVISLIFYVLIRHTLSLVNIINIFWCCFFRLIIEHIASNWGMSLEIIFNILFGVKLMIECEFLRNGKGSEVLELEHV